MAADLEEGAEPDQLEGTPHPREQVAFHGHPESEKAFLDAMGAGRLHHAWLIGGAEGIGKATLAYRVAKFLLAYPRPPSPLPETLRIGADHPVARQVAARSHPNLAVLRRTSATDKKAASATIPVEAVRKATALFGSTAADAGYRICVVDSAEDLTLSSANALLKLIEEPPARSLFLIVSHAPRRVLPTIRSRCRRLDLRPLGELDLRAVVRSLGSPWAETDEGLLAQAIRGAEGSVRRTLEMLDEAKIQLVAELTRSLDALPAIDMKYVLSLSESLSRKDAEDRYDLALDTVFRWASGRVRAQADLGAARLAPLVEVCDKIARSAREVDVFNLDRRPLVISLFDDLAQAVRRAA